MGGGRSKFLTPEQGGERKDGEDLIETWKLDKKELNETYAYVSNRSQLLSLMEQKVLPNYILGMLFFPSN